MAMEIEEITPRITTNGISMENGDSNGNAMDKPPQTTPSRPTCHPDFVKFIGMSFPALIEWFTLYFQ